MNLSPGKIIIAIMMNLLLLIVIYFDMRDNYRQRIAAKRKLENLKLDVIHLDLTEDEMEMLNQLKTLSKDNSNSQYIRRIIKNQVNIA